MTILASYASDPANSRGRLHDEKRGVTRGPRDDFQRDRDRIIHSISFRRLRYKTQVFIAPDGDHYRVRLTHSLEVAQIGRTIARVLGLNEDLTEALCLAHDIGHPPFGHAGEDALQAALADHGGFDHNAQTIRTLMLLENPYPRWPGLNLSWETLEGLAKHNGPVRDAPWALQAADQEFDLELTSWPSLEAQIAAISDDIAYDNHDIDDGIRAGLLTLEQLLELPFIAARWQDICHRFDDIPQERLLPELIRDQIGLMVNDVLDNTRGWIAQLGIETVEDVRAAGQMIGGFSDEMAEQERALKGFMYENLYHHPQQLAAAEEGKVMVADLVTAYRDDPSLMPERWFRTLPTEEPARMRHIADFMAGMTDRYAKIVMLKSLENDMADRILIVGATGLIGGLLARKLIENGIDERLHLLFRRPYREEVGKAKVHVQLQENWPDTIAKIKPETVFSCLGTTMKKAGSKEAFAAVDRDLVASVAAAAKAAGTRHFLAVSSTMADSSASNFYLKTKGEAEDALCDQNFERLDIIRPGLLRGERSNDHRLGESLAIAASPVLDLVLHGKMRRYRSILASDVADAMVVLMAEEQPGVHIYENDDIWGLV